ncbi:L,D-transpeptidase family protein [Sinirhodobacter sp. WL0062]|uniref:L,D-transpeptidase family protein n=1 Tax=Rhodobacter flavimaris TaxID=2907145 RepID=A0ABS8YX52_9RHOB|nr:L,D-transpeptidase family protein [Sinirhodobacter sp. WL0062]MCE5972305.1 L,D-transpeptidase family protein [Sinirhodobacter sp. WL0062]
MVATLTVGLCAPRAEAQMISGYAQAIAEVSSTDAALSAFYAQRNYEPIWTGAGDAARRAALLGALDMAAAHGLPAGRYDAEGLRAQFAALRSERERGMLEVAMSRAFLTYAHDVSNGVLEPKKIDSGIVREIPRRDGLVLLQGLAAASDEPMAYMRSLAPRAPQYAQLIKARLDLQAQIARGGWGATVPVKVLHPGDDGPAVVALRDRLQAMGYLGRSATAVYDAEVQKAVQQYQFDLGMTADGVAGESTLKEINRAPEERMQSILVAMERLRWMNGLDLGARHVWVNIADFSVRIFDHGKQTFESVTVVGQNQSDRRTPEFSDKMEMMVINPTWHVPRSITVKEYLPMMQRNPNAAGHINLIDSRGRTVPRSAVDFAAYDARNFPFAMKQPPSDGNALGLVKFLFPNPYNIYLHDTPSKSLFEKEVRAYSHGCIRVGRPFDLAYALLAPQTDDPEGYFKKVLNTGAETTVKLETPVPVHLVYFTAWPTTRGKMEYRRDIYERDAALWSALENAGVELQLLAH